MKNDSNPIIRSEETTIDMHICAALSESGGSGEIYFAAIAPDMELTVITLDEAPDILPCFDEDDAYLNMLHWWNVCTGRSSISALPAPSISTPWTSMPTTPRKIIRWL